MIKTITYKDYLRMERKAQETVRDIPKHHCRVREEEYSKELIKACKNAKERTCGKPKYIVVVERYNQGTKRYPQVIDMVSIRRIINTKETVKTFAGYRKSNILAIVKWIIVWTNHKREKFVVFWDNKLGNKKEVVSMYV